MIQVADYLYRGPRPNSIKELVDSKIDTSLCLEYGFYEAFHDDDYENRCRWVTNIHFINYPLGDFLPPTVFELQKIAKIIQMAIDNKETILVHCLHGVDRTGMAIAAWQIIYDGWLVEDAITGMKDMGFHTFPYFYWIPVLRRLK